MHRLALVIAFALGTIGFAFAQAPPLTGITRHKGTCNPARQRRASLNRASIRRCDGRTSAARTMQGMMHMMQGMQGMMRMMHQRAQSEQRQPARTQTMQDCPMMVRTSGVTGRCPTSETVRTKQRCRP